MSRKLITISTIMTLMSTSVMADVPNVAADIAPVHSLVSRVMEGVGAPKLVIKSGASPHDYRLRPSEAKALQDADLVFWMGEELTPWMNGALETLASKASITTLLDQEGVTLHDFRESALFEAHDHDEDKDHKDHDDHDDHDDDNDHKDHDDHDVHDDDNDHKDHDYHDDHNDDKDHKDHDDHDDHNDDKDHKDHDDHGGHDPHAWLSPENAKLWLNIIASKLSVADPQNAASYFMNAAAGQAEMEEMIVEVNVMLKPVQGGKFVVFHDAYQYFENDFDFYASGAISLGDSSDPSPARIQKVQKRIRDEGIQCVLAEPQFNEGLVVTVMEGSEATASVIDPLGAELNTGPNLYTQLIKNMAKTLRDCL
ncbi:zinc ABC transporter substrate-binding protein [Amylibacter sp.]|nr:zinc ABC transporter substrate-binding protein [Amylibacter sp.]